MDNLSCENLIAMGRHIPTPFLLSITKDQGQEDLRIDSILRIVPGKRLVAVTTWGGSAVIVKLFFRSGHWKRNLLHDIRGINLLRQRLITTPEVLHQTTTADNQGALLLIDYLQQGKSLEALFDQSTDSDATEDVVRMAISTIAKCHQSGLWQRDMHLDNFILSSGRVYLLDGGDIESVDDELECDIALNNLALFFAQFPVSRDAWIPKLLDHYQSCSTELTPHEIDGFSERVRSSRQNRLRHFEKKLFRSTTANRCFKNMNKFVVYDRTIHCPELDYFVDDPNSYINEDKILKAGNSSTVALIKIGEREFILKRYNIKNFWHGLKRLLQPSRAHHSWRNANVLEMLGIATPHPYLFMEERVLWLFRRRAYFLAEYISDHTLKEQLDSAQSSINTDELVESFNFLFHVMEDYRLSHGDMKATNFIYQNNNLYVLDLDAMKRHKSEQQSSAELQKDLQRFQRNWQGTKFGPLFRQMTLEGDS